MNIDSSEDFDSSRTFALSFGIETTYPTKDIRKRVAKCDCILYSISEINRWNGRRIFISWFVHPTGSLKLALLLRSPPDFRGFDGQGRSLGSESGVFRLRETQ